MYLKEHSAKDQFKFSQIEMNWQHLCYSFVRNERNHLIDPRRARMQTAWERFVQKFKDAEFLFIYSLIVMI